MGWNSINFDGHWLFKGLSAGDYVYFVHSYYVDMSDPNEVIGSSHYGHQFAAAFARDNIVAAQFHPEKSHVAGLRLIRNFLNWNGEV